jgi:ABC-type bacteriocin/lantibiotic exporter with double-glycine peptidase domain
MYLGFVLLLTGLAAGCMSRKFAELRPGLETRGSYIEGVPFYQQSESTCGPAALASILDFRGRQESLERITGKIYLPELRGTLPIDMEKYAREAGFKTVSLHGSLGELKAHIRKGIPVICLLDLGFSLYRLPHYVSVIGFDDGNEVFIVHDGSAPNSLIGYEKFNKKWVRAGYWMLVIEPNPEEGRK